MNAEEAALVRDIKAIPLFLWEMRLPIIVEQSHDQERPLALPHFPALRPHALSVSNVITAHKLRMGW